MPRILLMCSVALLGACGVSSAQQSNLENARLACADVGIAPGSSAFDQCLYYALWDLQNDREN